MGMAVKINEPTQLDIDLLVKLCRGYYTKKSLLALEQEILASLEWRVCISTTTPMEYVRFFLELLPEWADAAGTIEENATAYMDRATSDIYFSTCRTSSVGLACLAGALNDTYVLSALDKERLWRQLSDKLGFDVASNEIRKVERQLLGDATSRQRRRKSRASLPRTSIGSSASGQQSSPVSIMQAAE